ncbi:aldose 1-epimerase (plasmid) [Ensifer adhaerens]|uniref:aldose epimerase family protein n=1 Tax=Ensifer adhaerens TaxID=106592 RepID=UPI003CF355E3
MPDEVTIKGGPLRASFRPQIGGRLTRLAHDAFGEIIVPFKDSNFDPLDWPKSGAFPLLPYHGRLKGARITYDEKLFQLVSNPFRGGDSMHGPAQRRPWHVGEKSPETLELTLDYRADEEWPWSFRAHQRFRITSDRLDLQLLLTNSGSTTMPAGLGWHPYFAASTDAHLSCDAKTLWPPASEIGLADSHPRQRVPAEPLPNDPFTQQLSEWGYAKLVSKDLGLELHRGSGFTHLVVHRTPSYVCLEPVSHVGGAIGLSGEFGRRAGLVALPPGQSLSGNVRVLFPKL